MGAAIKAYTIIAYPESMPDDWTHKLDKLGIGYACVLHDKDIDTNGQLKKAHMHFFFLNPVKEKEKKYISACLGVNYMGQNVRSVQGMYEYLTHENETDKYHYPKDIIKYSVNWSQETYEQLKAQEKDTADHTLEVLDIIEKYDIKELVDLIHCLRSNGLENLLPTAKQYFFKTYLDSRRNAGKR